MNDNLVTALIAGPGGAIVVLLVQSLINRRNNEAAVEKTEAETEKTEAETASLIQAGYERYIGSLEDRFEKLEKRVKDLETALHASEAQVRGLNRLLRATMRWALTLRDELVRLGGEVPTMPADIEFALTTLDPGETP